jgi:hypothetical protein
VTPDFDRKMSRFLLGVIAAVVALVGGCAWWLL